MEVICAGHHHVTSDILWRVIVVNCPRRPSPWLWLDMHMSRFRPVKRIEMHIGRSAVAFRFRITTAGSPLAIVLKVHERTIGPERKRPLFLHETLRSHNLG
jgi:hypothetical protein